MIALETLQLTPEFVASFRALGKKVGYRNLGRAIAYCETPQTSNGQPRVTSIAPNGNGHKPTCAETAERISAVMETSLGSAYLTLDDLARKVHNYRVFDHGDGSPVEGCPCGDSKLQYAEVPTYTPRARASTRSRPYKGKRCHPICCQMATEKGHEVFHRHIETHWTQWPSLLRTRGWNEVKGDSEWRVQAVADYLPARVCCKHKMGLTPDYTDAHHWRYQCDKNPDHCQDVMITIGPS